MTLKPLNPSVWSGVVLQTSRPRSVNGVETTGGLTLLSLISRGLSERKMVARGISCAETDTRLRFSPPVRGPCRGRPCAPRAARRRRRCPSRGRQIDRRPPRRRAHLPCRAERVPPSFHERAGRPFLPVVHGCQRPLPSTEGYRPDRERQRRHDAAREGAPRLHTEERPFKLLVPPRHCRMDTGPPLRSHPVAWPATVVAPGTRLARIARLLRAYFSYVLLLF